MEIEVEKKDSKCSNCFESIELNAFFCSSCGYPENGTDKEKSVFHANNVMEKNKHFDADKVVKSARTTLFVMSGITFLSGVVFYFLSKELAVLIVNIILTVIYVALGFWSKKKPLAAIFSGLVLYVTVIVLNGLIDPSTIFKGIILKGVVLFYLGKGLYSAKAAQKNNERTS